MQSTDNQIQIVNGLNVSIPQAVSTIAICERTQQITHPLICMVSIPQAVSTIAMLREAEVDEEEVVYRFNTASGKHYCNSRPYKVSIHGA